MTAKDGRNATSAYRVRVGGVWYWVDPAVPVDELEPGDIVIVYARGGESALAVLRSAVGPTTALSSLEGEAFDLARNDIAALHLAAVDDDQS